MAVAVTLLILAVNARALLGTELYEHGDGAVNSLQILRAKHFRELYGQYSRWGFHHPGPGWFYAQAAGEALFYDALRVAPTPLNAQLLTIVAVLAAFFAAAMATAARWVQSRWFVPLTLLLATLHFAAVNGATVFVSNWPAFVMVTPFLCLLVAAASVGAGRGQDLPLLVLAGGALMHAHIAQPLFVLPLWALAYVGLLWTGGRERRQERREVALPPGTGKGQEEQAGGLAWRVPPWRVFPRAHGVALALAGLFALPVVIDLCRGAGSNFALVLAHRRAHVGEHHSWLESVLYFLRFGVYRPYRQGEEFYRGGTTPTEVSRFLVNHPGMLLAWGIAILVFVGGWAWARRQGVRLRGGETDAAGDREPRPAGSDPATAATARGRFLGWLGACLTVTVGLTLVWGVIQDGRMFYFNAWFNYAIFFALAMGAAAGASVALEGAANAARLAPRLQTGLAGALLALAAGCFALRHERFRADYGGDDASRAMVRSVAEALAAQPGEPRLRYLSFPHPAWEAAAGVALQLERRGYGFRAPPGWWLMFGHDRSPEQPSDGLSNAGGPPFRPWRIALPAVDAGAARTRPLVQGWTLATDIAEIDPTAGAEIAFTGGSRTFAPYVLYGWAPPDPAAPFTYSVGAEGALSFCPRPVATNTDAAGTAVEITFDLLPVLSPGKRERQRLGLRFNDVELGVWQMDQNPDADGTGPLRVRVPAATWNARPEALLAFRFPDAVSPAEIDPDSGDTRPFAFGFRSIRFRAVVPGSVPSR